MLSFVDLPSLPLQDFAQERRLKRAAAKKISRDIGRLRKDEEDRAARAEREKERALRKVASSIAKEVRGFWANVEKVPPSVPSLSFVPSLQLGFDTPLKHHIVELQSKVPLPCDFAREQPVHHNHRLKSQGDVSYLS